MTAKLIKYPENEWVVEVPEDNKGIKGSMMQGHFASTFGHGYKLSLKNCQAIERGYDLDELAENIKTEDGFAHRQSFIVGFQKALELIGDKAFNEKDGKFIFECGRNYQVTGDTDCHFKNAIQSLQQTEWDVEIEMEYHPTFQIVKLDEEGCLILTFKSE